MSPFAAGLLEAKRVSEPGAPQVPVTIYRAGEKFTVGPFSIEAIPVAHSIPEPMALGHEYAGEVIEVGPEVTSWKVGDRVAYNSNNAPADMGRGGECGERLEFRIEPFGVEQVAARAFRRLKLEERFIEQCVQ